MQSENINELAAALVLAQAEFSAVPKGGDNPFFKSKYVKLSDAMSTAGPILAKHGLAVTQFQSEGDTLTTYLLHSSGQFIAHRADLHLVKDDPQSAGSATTYARRYGYMSCLGLVADDDDDGNAATPRGFQSQSVGGGGTSPQAQQVASAQVTNSDDPRIDAILRAAQEGDNPFLTDLASKFIQYGKLSDKQIEAGFKTASKMISTPRSAPVREEIPFEPVGGFDEDERF
jgi:hypothetical protein